MKWMTHFSDFFRQRAERVHTILDAAGCREGWVQGEMFLNARDVRLKTNATHFKFDLLCSEPPMIAEIKICGGDYAPKMRGFIQDDVRKLACAEGAWQRFMILIVDNRHPTTALGKWLTTCDFPHTEKQDVTLSEAVLIRIWEITEEAQQTPGGDSQPARRGSRTPQELGWQIDR